MTEQTQETRIEARAGMTPKAPYGIGEVVATGADINRVIEDARAEYGHHVGLVLVSSGPVPAGWAIHEDRRLYPIGYLGEAWQWAMDAYLRIVERTRELAPTLGTEDRQLWIGAAMEEAASDRRWLHQVTDADISNAILRLDGETLAQVMMHSA